MGGDSTMNTRSVLVGGGGGKSRLLADVREGPGRGRVRVLGKSITSRGSGTSTSMRQCLSRGKGVWGASYRGKNLGGGGEMKGAEVGVRRGQGRY